MVRRSLVALATVFATVYACEDDDGFRRACGEVALDGSLCEAHEVLHSAGGRYGGFIDGEHRYVHELDWCAVTVDDDGAVVRVRYLSPDTTWQAP